jgi:hypothetical protein
MRARATRLSAVGGVGRARDPVLSAGGIYLLDTASRYVRPGLAFARAQQVFGAQADSSLAAYTGSQVPWEPQGVRLDPGWTQNCLWSDEITAARGWNLAFITPDINAGGVPPPYPGGSYTRLTINSAGLSLIYRTATVTPGASQTLSFMVRLGTLAASDFKFGIYNETALSWIAVDQVPAVTPTANGWSRCDVSVTIPAGCTTIRLYPFRNNIAAAGGTFYLSLVNGTTTSYPVPLVKTEGLAVTVPNFSFGALLSELGITLGSEYTIGVEYTLANLSANYQPISFSLSNNTFNESVYQNAATLTAGREPNWAVIDEGVGQANSMGLGPATVVGQLRKTAVRVRANDFRSAFNGVLTLPDTVGTLPTVDRIYVGLNWSGTAPNAFQGHIRKLWLVPPVGLSDSQLQSLSA